MPNLLSRVPRTPRSRIGAIAAFVGLSAITGILVSVAVTPAVAMTGAAAQSSIGVFNGLPGYLKIQPLDQRSTIYATKGGQEVPIATFYAQNRQDVGWTDVASVVKDAAVDTEDPNFYTEGGVNITGTIRATLSTALGSSVQGGSSITQQYVKNVLVQKCDALYIDSGSDSSVTKAEETRYEKCYEDAAGTTVDRKLKEIRLAVGVSQAYSKKQILMGYLNITGFGGQVYGIQAAAEYYFGVPAKGLNLEQAATLVAILNNPANLRIDQPTSKANGTANGYKLTLERRNYVLSRMLAKGSITSADYAAAIKTPITPVITPVESGCAAAAQYNAAFFCNYVESTFLQDPAFGKTEDDRTALFNEGGLSIYTSLNLDLQATAQQAVSAYIPATDPNLDLGASNVSMEVGTGRIVTMVENRPYNDTATATPGTTAINYNTDYDYGGSGGFQTGSSFKAFDLAAWLQAGFSLNDVIDASDHYYTSSDFTNSCADIDGPPWPVSNDEGSASSLTVLAATEESVNTAFTKMATKLDLCNISNIAKSMGLHPAYSGNPWIQSPSMVLGVNSISPLTMATAYAGFANNGIVCTPIAIDKVVDGTGKSLPVPKTTCTQGVSSQIAAGVVYALEHVMTNGTAETADPRDGVPIMGKTGTTDNSVQNWLVTSTTKVANATWVGNVSGDVALRSQYFRGVGGGDVKFSIAKPILRAINAVYGGGQFTAAPTSELYGSYAQDNRSTAPSPTATPAPTSGSTPAPSAGSGSGGGTGTGGGTGGTGTGGPGTGDGTGTG